MTDLAPIACTPHTSRGRRIAEEESAMRNLFQRDRDRILHSNAFRRLEYKTQVFVNHEGDHYRTRLTHSLEVSQVARSLCRMLKLNEDLAEALALAHDLGHAPFGHAGEDGLKEAMAEFGGFDHNAHTLKIVTKLEHKYAAFDGLNLTWETLEGIAKHNGPVANKTGYVVEYNAQYDLELGTFASAEAQVASLADDIAYTNHDLDDGLRAGLFTFADLMEVEGVGPLFLDVARNMSGQEISRLIHESIRRLIRLMCEDLLKQTQENIAQTKVDSPQAVRRLGQALVSFSPQMQEIQTHLRAFLYERMYRHYKVNRMSSKARRVVKDLFQFFLNEPECLPTAWRAQASGPKSQQTAQVVADFIAGMTDRFALDEHDRLFDVWKLT